MKILYFYQYFCTPKGAWGTRVYDFAKRWVQKGHSVTVVTSVYDKSDLRPQSWLEQINVDGIDVRIIGIRLSNKDNKFTRLLTFLAYAFIASWYALILPADIVVSSSGPITVGIPGLIAKYLRGRRFVFEVRDLWPEGAVQLGVLRNSIIVKLAYWFEKICYVSAFKIIVLSEGMADWIRQRYGFQHIEVVPNSSNKELFSSKNEHFSLPEWAGNKKLILYTGSMGLMNQCMDIVLAAEELSRKSEKEILLVLIGDGKERSELAQYASKHQIPNIFFLGNLPKDEMAEWTQRATALLLIMKSVPVLDTVSPNKMFDAFAAGLPVIQTTQGWIKELMAKENCGITVPQNDPRAIADQIVKVCHDEVYRSEICRNAFRVSDRFDVNLLAEKMINVLEGVAVDRG